MISRRTFIRNAAAFLTGAEMLAGCNNSELQRGAGGGKHLNIFSWADYLHPNAISDFEKRYGIEVIYDTFASNEGLLARMEAGSVDYDVIVPTMYAVTKLKKLHVLQPIDHERLPNYKYLMDRFRHLSYDPGNQFSVPYTFGTTGIAYNKHAFAKAGVAEPQDWDIFWDPRFAGRITLLEDARETLGFALKRRGYSYNSVDPRELSIAVKDLQAQKKLMMCYTSDQVIVYLASGDAQLSLAFSGDAHQARRTNDHVGYVIPESGASMWIDNMCVPATAPHVEAAYSWMNYILEPDVAAQLTNYTYYPTPNSGAVKRINAELLADKTLYPSTSLMDKCEEIADLGDGIFLYDRAWTELKCM